MEKELIKQNNETFNIASGIVLLILVAMGIILFTLFIYLIINVLMSK